MRREYIDRLPFFSLVKTDKALPSYIADRDFGKIMKLNCLDSHYKRAFQFYRDTGCRLSEPFVGEFVGTILVVPAKYSKSRMEKEIELDDGLISIYQKCKLHYDILWEKRIKNEQK